MPLLVNQKLAFNKNHCIKSGIKVKLYKNDH